MCPNTISNADPPSTRSRSRSKTRPKSSSSKPAFPDAKFDKNGCCVKHDTVKLAEQIRQDGRLLWKEVKMVRYCYHSSNTCRLFVQSIALQPHLIFPACPFDRHAPNVHPNCTNPAASHLLGALVRSSVEEPFTAKPILSETLRKVGETWMSSMIHHLMIRGVAIITQGFKWQPNG